MHKTFDYDNAYPLPVLEYKAEGWFACLTHLIAGKTILKTSTLNTFLQHFLKDLTFREIYEKFHWKLNITVTDF
jgi:hypothetical protein